MAMKEPYMIKTLEGAGDLTLVAKPEESLRIIDIQVDTPASAYATAKVEKATCGYFRVGGTLGNHLAQAPAGSFKDTLLTALFKLGLWRGIPIASGEKFILTGVGQAGSLQKVVYEIYDAADMKPDMPNGSKGKEYDLLNYGRLAAFLAGENAYTVQQNPTEYPGFPYVENVPANKEITIFGMAFSDVARRSGAGANQQQSRFVKFVKDREVLFDEDRLGIPSHGLMPAADGVNVGKGTGNFGNYNNIDERQVRLFPKPLVFKTGEALDIYLNTQLVLGAVNLTATDTEIALIERVASMGA